MDNNNGLLEKYTSDSFYDDVVTVGKTWMYIIDGEKEIFRSYYLTNPLELIDSDLRKLLIYLSKCGKVDSFRKTSQNEFHFNITGTEYEMVIIVSLALMKVKEFEKEIQNRTVDKFIEDIRTR